MTTILVPDDYSTIAAALAAADTDDEIVISAGTYAEGALARVKSGIIFRAATGDEGLVIIDAAGNASGILPYTDWEISGIELKNAVGPGIIGNGSNRVFTVRDCTIHDCDDDGIAQAKAGSVLERLTIYECGAKGIDAATQDVTVSSCLVYDCDDVGIKTTTGTVEHCTVFNTGRTGGSYQIEATSGTVRNSVARQQGRSGMTGIRATTYDNCCSHGHDTNFHSSPDAESIELDPLFVSEATPTLRLTAASPCVGAGSAAASATTDRDGIAWVAPPSMGAYELGRIVTGKARGTHQVWLDATHAWGGKATDPDTWSCSGPPDAPLVADVVAGGDATELVLSVDRTLREGVSYTFTPTIGLADGTIPASFAVAGLRAAAPDRGDGAGELVDLVIEDGKGFARTHSGDLATAGGLATVRRIVLDILRTARGSVPWAPRHGADLAHKRPRPLDLEAEAKRLERLIERVPRVTNATVQLTWTGTQMVVDAHVATELGDLPIGREEVL